MNYHIAEFVLSAVSKKQFLNDLPEIVFCGRSNVGKSTILNSILGRKSLARTSSKPGKTAQINYYRIDHSCYFVDLPGYGYANVSNHQLEVWASYISTYFETNQNKALAVLLVDLRHDPTELDREMSYMIAEHEIPYIIVGTKADKLNKSEFKRQLQVYEEWCSENQTLFIPYSGITGLGRTDVMDCIEQALDEFGEKRNGE